MDVAVNSIIAATIGAQEAQQQLVTQMEQMSIPETAAATATGTDTETTAHSPHKDDAHVDPHSDDKDIDISLTPLPFQLALLSFPVRDISACAYAILHALMNPTWHHTRHDMHTPTRADAASFFSFTESGDTITMIVEQVGCMCGMPRVMCCMLLCSSRVAACF